MKRRKQMKMKRIFLVFFTIVLIYAISWGATVGLLWLACWVFNWAKLYSFFSIGPIIFSWKIATAIWALLCILKTILGSGSSSKNS